MLDAGPSVDRPEQISPAAPVPEPAATSKATPAARLVRAGLLSSWLEELNGVAFQLCHESCLDQQ